MQVLITTAAGAAQQGDAGRAEYVLHLAGVLGHNVHQPLQCPAIAAAPHFLEGHHYEEAQTAGSGQAWLAPRSPSPGSPGPAGPSRLSPHSSSRKPPSYVSSLCSELLSDPSGRTAGPLAHLLDGNPSGTTFFCVPSSLLCSQLRHAVCLGVLEL